MNPPNKYPFVAYPSPQCIDPRLLTDPFSATYPNNAPTFTPGAKDDGSPSANRMHVAFNSHLQGGLNEYQGSNQQQQSFDHQASTDFGAQPEQQQQHQNQQYQQHHQQYQQQQYQQQQYQQQQLNNYAPNVPQNPQWGTFTGVVAQTYAQPSNPCVPQQQATTPTSPPYANSGQPTPPTPNRPGESQSPKSTQPLGVSKGRRASTREEKLAKHKQDEAIRRNIRQTAYERVRDQVRDVFKDGTRKQNTESHILPCAVKQLEYVQKKNRTTMARNEQLYTDLINRGAQRSPVPTAPMQ